MSGVRHQYVSSKGQSADGSLVSKNEWNALHDLGDFDKAQVVVVFDAGASYISGHPEVDVRIPAPGTITSYVLLADQAGDAVIDIWKDSYANFPPTVADTITASAKPTLSAAAKSTDATLTGWTTALAAGDILRVHVDSATSVRRLTLTLAYTRS